MYLVGARVKGRVRETGPDAATRRATLARMEAVTAFLALVAMAALAWAVRGRSQGAAAAATAAVSRVEAELGRVRQAQDALRLDLARGREATLLGLAEAAQTLQGQIGQAQRALAEVKALEQGRARQLDYATDALRRVEAVLAGSTARGAAGENLLARAFVQLPPDLLAHDVAFGGKVVEYALRLPGGRYLPIDSKWTSLGTLEALDQAADDPLEVRRLGDEIRRDLRGRLREMTKYLDPQRTLGLAVLAVPDAAYGAAPEAHAEGWRDGILIVPYSQTLPFVLSLYRLACRFGASPEPEALLGPLRAADDAVRRIEDEVEGRLSRALVQLANGRDALRGHAADARGSVERMLRAGERLAEPAIDADRGSL
jgi:DNA recombination protein RmuC